MKGGSLMMFQGNRYSQNGEDGVIAEVMRRLGIDIGTFVEFGVGNGRDLSNTLALAERGWSGAWIECNSESAQKARDLAAAFEGRVEMLEGLVTTTGNGRLDEFLRATRVPRNLSFMSIDIDSHDLEVWRSIREFRAKVLLIEINSTIPIGEEQVHGDGKEGASFTSMMKVAAEKGYRLACHTGNLLFVDDALHSKLRLPAHEVDDPHCIFNDTWTQWRKA